MICEYNNLIKMLSHIIYYMYIVQHDNYKFVILKVNNGIILQNNFISSSSYYTFY